MKATQVNQQEVKFTIPKDKRGGTCGNCKSSIDDYRGIYVSNGIFCDWKCATSYMFPNHNGKP